MRHITYIDMITAMNQTVIIYAIVRTDTGHAYVGSTISLSERWNHHRYFLRHDKHHCRHLQRAWAKYGEDAFEFREIERVVCASRQERYLAELAWIERLGHYNHLVPSSRSGRFTVHPGDREHRRRAILDKMAADPAFRAFLQERGAAIGAWMKTPDGRTHMAAHTKRRWSDPELSKDLARGLENRWASPDAREHMARKTGERMRSPGVAAAHAEKLKLAWQDPTRRAKLQARLEARWSDPEAKARQSAALKAAWARRKAASKA